MADASVGSRLLDPTEVRRLADGIGLRPTKGRGQNFVVDPGTIRRIVRASGVGDGDVALEIGPGLGSLTLGLLPAVRHLLAVEVDAALAAALPDTVDTHAGAYADRLTVLHADALSLASTDLPEAHSPHALVANLPYNVAVPVFLHLLEALPTLREGLVLVQAEIAERLAAPSGGRLYGAPSVKAAWFADVWRVGVVGRNVFWPRPNVDSALVGWRRRPPPRTTACRREVFAVVDAAFQQRRKTLRAALARWAGGAEAAERMLRSADIDPRARGETLDVASFARLAEQRAASP